MKKLNLSFIIAIIMYIISGINFLTGNVTVAFIFLFFAMFFHFK